MGNQRPHQWPATWNPQGPLPGHCRYTLDRSHWAAGSCAGLWLPGRGVPQNLITGEIATVFNVPGQTVGPAGIAYTNAGAARNGWQLRNGPIIAGISTWTIVAVTHLPSGMTTAGFGRPLYCERASSGNDILKLHMGEGRTSPGFVYRNTSGNIYVGNASGDYRGNRLMIAAASMVPGGGGRLIRTYADGLNILSTDWGANSTAQTNSNVATLGYDQADTSSFSAWFGDIAMVAVFRMGWSDAQHAAFWRAPYQLLTPAG